MRRVMAEPSTPTSPTAPSCVVCCDVIKVRSCRGDLTGLSVHYRCNVAIERTRIVSSRGMLRTVPLPGFCRGCVQPSRDMLRVHVAKPAVMRRQELLRLQGPCDGDAIAAAFSAYRECASLIEWFERIDPLCFVQTELDRVVFTRDPARPFEDFGLWGDSAPPGWVFDEEADVFFEDKQHYATMKSLRGFGCRLCKKYEPSNLDALKKHYKSVHQMEMCHLCASNLKIFLQEQKLYTAKQIKQHLETRDDDIAGNSHQRCEFCQCA